MTLICLDIVSAQAEAFCVAHDDGEDGENGHLLRQDQQQEEAEAEEEGKEKKSSAIFF